MFYNAVVRKKNRDKTKKHTQAQKIKKKKQLVRKHKHTPPNVHITNTYQHTNHMPFTNF
jgi:hypothetical protein